MGTKGYKSTEFYVTLFVVLLGAFMGSGLLPESHWAMQAAGVAASILAALGYQVNRTMFKRTKLQSDSLVGAPEKPKA